VPFSSAIYEDGKTLVRWSEKIKEGWTDNPTHEVYFTILLVNADELPHTARRGGALTTAQLTA